MNRFQIRTREKKKEKCMNMQATVINFDDMLKKDQKAIDRIFTRAHHEN